MPIPRRDFVKLGLALGGLTAAAMARAVEDPANNAELDALWTDLEKGPAEATRAVLKLSDRPAEAVAFLKEKLKALKIEPGFVRTLIQMLGSDDEAESKSAFEELEYFDPRLAVPLETLMDDVKDYPARSRLVEVLSGRELDSLKGKKVELSRHGQDKELFYNFFAPNVGSWWAEAKVSELNSRAWGNLKRKWTRAVRALVLLEHIATPEAVAILKTMAGGDPDAEPTRQAKESLEKVADVKK